jgi:hypothetical protein
VTVFRFSRIWLVVGVLVAIWAMTPARRSGQAHVRPLGTPVGPVRILQFYASAGSVTPGEKAKLCYGVENARAVRISPAVSEVYPSPSRCLEIVPERTTHYMILAEGFDGAVATRSFTLAVVPQTAPQHPVNYATDRAPSCLKPDGAAAARS